jgi:hypothetical protein
MDSAPGLSRRLALELAAEARRELAQPARRERSPQRRARDAGEHRRRAHAEPRAQELEPELRALAVAIELHAPAALGIDAGGQASAPYDPLRRAQCDRDVARGYAGAAADDELAEAFAGGPAPLLATWMLHKWDSSLPIGI